MNDIDSENKSEIDIDSYDNSNISYDSTLVDTFRFNETCNLDEISNLIKKNSEYKFCSVTRLTLFLIPIFIILLFFYGNSKNTPIFIFFISLIIYWNFPIIVTINNSKPLYYEDLFINSKAIPKLELETKAVEKFINIYRYIIIFTNSLLTAVLSEYWIYKTKFTNSIYEIIGVTGGILQIFNIVNNYTGIGILKLLKIYIRSRVKINIIEDT